MIQRFWLPPTASAKATALDSLVATLLIYLSCEPERLSLRQLLSRLDSTAVLPPWLDTVYLPRLSGMHHRANTTEFLRSGDKEVRGGTTPHLTLALQTVITCEDQSGADVCALLVDSANVVCGVLTVACCRYAKEVPSKKCKSQERKVQIREQYCRKEGQAKTIKTTQRTSVLRRVLSSRKLFNLVELQVRSPVARHRV